MGIFDSVYEVVLRVPAGRVTTYGTVARLIGSPRLGRQVGWALHVNPQPGVIPCHRVLDRFGRLCRGFAFGGEDVQRQLLEAEGVKVTPDGVVDLAAYGWPEEFFAREKR